MILVIVAVRKSVHELRGESRISIDPGDAILSLVDEYIWPNLNKDAVMDADGYNESRLYTAV